jgi:hypothetical protein
MAENPNSKEIPQELIIAIGKLETLFQNNGKVKETKKTEEKKVIEKILCSFCGYKVSISNYCDGDEDCINKK